MSTSHYAFELTSISKFFQVHLILGRSKSVGGLYKYFHFFNYEISLIGYIL